MLTNKFTHIAEFVTKVAYIYVVCNTYIPKVYIKMPAITNIAEIPAIAFIAVVVSRPSLQERGNTGIKIQ
jgi:hypothetical protein